MLMYVTPTRNITTLSYKRVEYFNRYLINNLYNEIPAGQSNESKQDEIKYWYAQGIISVVVAVFCLNCY
jgi:hypothetical protein